MLYKIQIIKVFFRNGMNEVIQMIENHIQNCIFVVLYPLNQNNEISNNLLNQKKKLKI